MDDLLCPQCGTPNPLDSNFCSVCGIALPEASGADHTAVHPAVSVDPGPDEMGMVVVTSGRSAGSRYAISGQVTVLGRHPDSTVFLDDVTVSRRHAEIRFDGGRYVISDGGSLNGTYVNGSRVDSVELAEGDQVQIGKFKLVFVLGVPSGEESGAEESSGEEPSGNE